MERNNHDLCIHNKKVYHTRFSKFFYDLKDNALQKILEAKQTWILSLLYILNAFCALKGIEYVSIPM